MAESSAAGQRDEGLSNLQAFIALVAGTRQALGLRQATMEARADALSSQAGSATSRLQSFDEAVSGLAESFAATAHTAAIELGRLAQVSTELADHLRGDGAEALRANEQRFTAGVEAARAHLEQGTSSIASTLAEVEQAADQGDVHTATLVADQEEGYADLGAAVAEADSSFSQADFELQGALETTTGYLAEGLEQYMSAVFHAFFEHLEIEVPPLLSNLLLDLGSSLHRALDEYDSLVESVSGEMADESESLMDHCRRELNDAQEDRETDRSHSLDEVHSLLEEGQRSRSAMDKGLETAQAYPPIVPQLAMAREVADRVQEMMDVFNPFGG